MRLAIDDFGAGYSSLGYLRRLAVDTLKIDRSFVEGMGHHGTDGAIVEAITSLAHTIGMDVTAEGMETSEQLSRVLAAGCDQAQGYYFAEPLPLEKLDHLLSSRIPYALISDALQGPAPELVRAPASRGRPGGRQTEPSRPLP
ncbi:MAG: EAL domain-containing protein [Chloroflexota bacterium]|nr:EAL domain-containing protein [Chloroflexota bacterium]